MVAYEFSKDSDSKELLNHCLDMKFALIDVFLMISKESRRLNNQFDELLSSPQTNQESVCLDEARKKSYEGKKRFFLLDISNKTGLVRSSSFCLS